MLRAPLWPALVGPPQGMPGREAALDHQTREALGFDAVYDGCVEFVWRPIRRLGVPAEAVEDVVQEVFFTVHRRLGGFEGRSSVKTWVFSIALHTVRHYHRSRHRRDASWASDGSADLDELPDLRSRSPLEAAELRDDVLRLDGLLRALDEDKREVLVLAHFEEMTAPQIAQVLGENVNTVYSRLRAARDEFEQALQRQCVRDAGRKP